MSTAIAFPRHNGPGSRALHEVLRQFRPRSLRVKSLKLPIVGEDQHSSSTKRPDEREEEKGHPLHLIRATHVSILTRR